MSLCRRAIRLCDGSSVKAAMLMTQPFEALGDRSIDQTVEAGEFILAERFVSALELQKRTAEASVAVSEAFREGRVHLGDFTVAQ